MRRLFKYLVTAAALPMVVGCWHNENTGSELIPELEFSPVVHILTRASSDYTTYPEEISFGILESSLPRGTAWSGNSSSARTDYNNEKISYSGGLWQPSDPEKIGTKRNLNMLAYAPYSSNATIDWENGVQFKDYNVESGDTLLMYAEPIYDYQLTSENDDVDVKFTKALSKVDFYAYSSSTGEQIAYIRKITLSGFKTEGSFVQLPTATWTVSGDEMEYDHFSGSARLDSKLQKMGESKTMIPQKFTASVTVYCDFYVNGEKVGTTQKLTKTTDMNWGICKRCVYVLDISSTGFEIILNSEIL